jgi:hypothetical protein
MDSAAVSNAPGHRLFSPAAAGSFQPPMAEPATVFVRPSQLAGCYSLSVARRVRRFHLDISPPVHARLGERMITFAGISLLRGVVMVEYDVEPPFRKHGGSFHAQYLVFHVTDDTGAEEYPTAWEDSERLDISEGRTTTRLDRRPPPAATRLHFVIRAADPAAVTGTGRRSGRDPVAQFDVTLPADHGEPWPERPGASQT